NLANVRLLGFDPRQVAAVLKGSDAVQYYAVNTGVLAELEQAGSQTLGLEQLAVGLDDHVAVLDGIGILDVVAIEEAVVQVAQVARLVGNSDLLGQTSAQGVGTGNDQTDVDTQI